MANTSTYLAKSSFFESGRTYIADCVKNVRRKYGLRQVKYRKFKFVFFCEYPRKQKSPIPEVKDFN